MLLAPSLLTPGRPAPRAAALGALRTFQGRHRSAIKRARAQNGEGGSGAPLPPPPPVDGDEPESPPAELEGQRDSLQLPPTVIARLRDTVFSFDTFFVNSVENYQAGGCSPNQSRQRLRCSCCGDALRPPALHLPAPPPALSCLPPQTACCSGATCGATRRRPTPSSRSGSRWAGHAALPPAAAAVHSCASLRCSAWLCMCLFVCLLQEQLGDQYKLYLLENQEEKPVSAF